MSNEQAVVLRGATIVTMDPGLGVIERGDLRIQGGRIADVGSGIPVGADDRVVDAAERIVVPGFVDTHRHMWEALGRGGAAHHSLGQYYVDVLGGWGSRLRPDDVRLGTLASAYGALSSGVTTVQDVSNIQLTPAHTDASIAALQASGVRAVFAYGVPFGRMTSHGVGLPDDVRRIRTESLSDDSADVTLSLLTEWGDDLGERHNAALARELGLRTVRHIGAETPISRLHRLGVLLPGTTFLHGNGLPPEELQIIADTGGTLSVAPGVELSMGHGIPVLGSAPPGLLLSLGVSAEVTVATDVFGQMRAALQMGRAFGRGAGSDRELTAAEVFAMATTAGAEALGLGASTGSLTPGKVADVVVLRADELDVTPVGDPVVTVVTQMDRRHVDRVYRAGRLVVRDGALTHDTSALVTELRAAARRLGPITRTQEI